MQIGTSIHSIYSIINCPDCNTSVSEDLIGNKTVSPRTLAPMLYLNFPPRGTTLETLIKDEFDQVRDIDVRCRNVQHCSANVIGSKRCKKVLEFCGGAFVVSVHRRDPQTQDRLFQPIDIGRDTIVFNEGTPDEIKVKMLATLEHTVAGGEF